MSWSIWQALRAREAAIRRRAEPPADPRLDHVPVPSLNVLLEIFNARSTPSKELSADAEPCIAQPKEAPIP